MKKYLLMSSFILLSLNVYGDNKDIIVEVPKQEFQNYSIKMVPSDNVKSPTIKYYHNNFGDKDKDIIHNPYKNNQPMINFEKDFNDIKKYFHKRMNESIEFHESLRNKINKIVKENSDNIKVYSSSRSFNIDNPKNIGKNVKLEGKNVSLNIEKDIKVGDNVIFDNIGKCDLYKDVPNNIIINLDNKKEFCK